PRTSGGWRRCGRRARSSSCARSSAPPNATARSSACRGASRTPRRRRRGRRAATGWCSSPASPAPARPPSPPRSTAPAVRRRGRRSSGPFVRVRAAAPDLEALLFGEGEGRRFAHLELALGGTLFVEDIEQMPLDLQGKLLKALREGKIERARPRTVDARL